MKRALRDQLARQRRTLRRLARRRAQLRMARPTVDGPADPPRKADRPMPPARELLRPLQVRTA